MGDVDSLSDQERKTRGAYHRARALRDACLCADEEKITTAVSELLRCGGLRDQSARFDELGLEFRYALRRAMADEFVKRRGLHDRR